MVQIKRMTKRIGIIWPLLLLWPLLSGTVQGAVFPFGSKKIQLPINPQWLSKAASADGLVFFQPQSPVPRLFINYYRTSFFYPKDSQEKFAAAFTKNKQEWIKSIEGVETMPPNFQYDPQQKKILSEYAYSAAGNNFRESVVIQECGGGESVALKILVPQKVNFDTTPLTNLVNICPH